MTGLETTLFGVLLILGIAAVVRFVASVTETTYYPVLLVVVGIGISIAGVQPSFRLSSEMIRTVLVPTILFKGAQRTKSEHFWPTLPTAVLLTVVGLPLAVLLLGGLVGVALGLPLAIGLLFAAIVYPIDPVAIIAVFRESSAAERVSVLAETESHLGDGVAIVVFGAVLGFVSERATTAEEVAGIVDAATLAGIGADVVVVSLGGVVVGLVAGAVVFGVLRAVDDRMTELLVLVVLPYASYLIAEHTFHVSGVLATVAAGLLVGTYGKDGAIHPDNVGFVERTWDTAAFLIFTLLFVMVGVQVPFRRVFDRAVAVLIASALLLVVRAIVVYGLLAATNASGSDPIPTRFQHVLVWGGMHTVIPVALLLVLPRDFPYLDTLGPLVFGVAVLSIVGQGLLLPFAVRLVGATEAAVEDAEETVGEAEEPVEDA